MISLRKSHRDDHWRTTYRRNYPISLQEIECADGEIFNGLKLVFKTGINAIVGRNGTGKSNFIRAIFNSFSSENSNRKKFTQLLDNSKINVKMEINGAPRTLHLNPNDDSSSYNDVLGLLFDPCNLVPDIQKLFSEQDNIEELLESFSPITLSNDDLKLVNFLTNNTYTKVDVINIEDEYDAFPMLPFFRVEQADVSYDSRSMGLGELSLLYFFWLIEHIKKSKLPCFLLVEEPESFLPPLVQDRFCDVLAMTSSTQGAAILISTHSEHILKKIPRSHIHIMRKLNGDIKFLSATSNVKQMSVLGLMSPKKGIILHEDHAANLFIRSFIKASSILVTDSFFYHNSGSEGDIVKDLSRFPVDLHEFHILGIFDGDCRGKLGDQLTKYKNYLFLPADKTPEELLIDFLKCADMSTVAMHLGTSTEALLAAIDVAAGADHHDYFHELAKTIEISYDTVFSRLCDLWVEDRINQNEVTTFISDLENKLA